MAFSKPAYPATLTKAGWSKNKDIVTELVKGKTGLGKALALAESSFGEIDFKMANTIGGKQFSAPTDPATKEFVASWNGLIDALSEVSTTAGSLSKELKKSKVTPKGTAEYVDSVISDANDLRKKFAGYKGA